MGRDGQRFRARGRPDSGTASVRVGRCGNCRDLRPKARRGSRRRCRGVRRRRPRIARRFSKPRRKPFVLRQRDEKCRGVGVWCRVCGHSFFIFCYSTILQLKRRPIKLRDWGGADGADDFPAIALRPWCVSVCLSSGRGRSRGGDTGVGTGMRGDYNNEK